MKKILAMMIALLFVFSLASCGIFDRSEQIRAEQSRLAEESRQAEESRYLEYIAQQAEYLEAAREFYTKISENAALIDAVASDICEMWKDADYDTTTKEINKKIARILEDHKENVDEINAFDKEIAQLLSKAKLSTAGYQVERAMKSYIEYRDSVLKADASFMEYGFIEISSNKSSLDDALKDLYVKL